jgi:hypothetical protein
VRAEALRYVEEKAKTVAANQCGDGSWGLDWYKVRPARETPRAASPPDEMPLIVTGHLLEWMMMLPEEMRPPRGVISRGAGWALAALAARQGDPDWVRKNYCPVVHATRAVRLLGGSGPRPPGPCGRV